MTLAAENRRLIGSAEKTMIDRIYREDFERFGYPHTL